MSCRAGAAKPRALKVLTFAQHWKDNAWAVANLEVGIGQIKKTGSEIVDSFNQLVMDAFNVASGNLLTPGAVLTWNVWFEEPALVDQKEWAEHAEKWRESIDADHGSPTGDGTLPKYFDGTLFSAAAQAIVEVTMAFIEWVYNHLPAEKADDRHGCARKAPDGPEIDDRRRSGLTSKSAGRL